MSEPLRILFIARAYPPTLGGMETFAFQLSEALGRRAHVRRIINSRGKRALPLFLPYALAQAALIARRERIDVIHLADALLAPIGAALRVTASRPVTASVCGLDVTYDNALYQRVVPRALERLDLTMPISEATEAELLARAARARSTVIPLGVNPLPAAREADRRRFRRLCGEGGRMVLTVGRLVQRKGVAWFAEHVLPSLPEDVTYAVIGDGSDAERERIVLAAGRAGVASRVRMLGRVDDGLLAAAYAEADAFVMPNIPIPGDIEGFGLVSLEASASGLLVLASDLEGIRQAVLHDRNGLLLPPRDPDAWVLQLRAVLAEGSSLPARASAFAAYTQREFGWDATAARYVDEMARVVQDARERAARRTRVSSTRSP